MNKVTKFILSTLAVLFLFMLNTNNNSVEASTFKINDLEKLKEEIVELNQIQNNEDGTETQEKIDFRLEIIENTNPEVLKEYHAILKDELENSKFDLSNSETIYDFKDSSNSEEVTLPESNAKVEVITENKVNNYIHPRLGVYNGTTDYLVTYKIKATLYPDSKAVLLTTYNVSSKGLTAESCSKAGTSGVFPTTIVASCELTDKTATQHGHDINAQGDYVVTIGGYNGIGIVSYDLGIRSSIKWVGTQSSSMQTVETNYTIQK